MKLLFKQRFLSWLDSYDIYDENGNVYFTVKSKLSLGHVMVIYDHMGREVGRVEQRLFTFLPKFDLYAGDTYFGRLCKEFTFFKPAYYIDECGWRARGNWVEWDYDIRDHNDHLIASINKEVFNWTDTYVIDVADEKDALGALMFVLSIDAEKCSRSS